MKLIKTNAFAGGKMKEKQQVLLRIWERFSYQPRKGQLAIKITMPATK